MSNSRAFRNILAFAIFLSFQNLSTAKADILGGDILGAKDIIHDAFNRADAVVQRVEDVLFALEKQANVDITQRIQDVGRIADETTSRLAALEAKSFSDVNQLVGRMNTILSEHENKLLTMEKVFMNDLSEKIREVECLSDTILQSQLKDALGALGGFLGTNQIKITPPLLYEGENEICFSSGVCRVSRTFEVYTPFAETYKEIRTYLEGRLAQMRPDTPAKSIVGTYDLLAALAKRATCKTEDKTYEAEFVNYRTQVRRWNDVLSFGGKQ